MYSINLYLRIIFLGFAAILYTADLMSQDNFESRVMEDYVFSCGEVHGELSQMLVNDFMLHNKLDSAKLLSSYWRVRCGDKEPVLRANILLDLTMDRFIWDTYFSEYTNFIMMVVSYKKTIKYDNQYRHPYSNMPLNSDFDNVFANIAASNISKYDSTDVKWLICKLYSDPEFKVFSYIQSGMLSDSNIYQAYHDVLDQQLSSSSLAAIVGVGAWLPSGDLKEYTAAPQIGIGLGFDSPNYGLQLDFKLRSLKIKNEYADNNPFGNLTGYSLGLNYLTPIFVYRRNRTNLIVGGAYEWLNPYVDEDIFAASFVLNAGVSLRLGITRLGSMELTMLYKIQNFSDDRFKYSSNAFTFMISWVFIDSGSEYTLEQLEY